MIAYYYLMFRVKLDKLLVYFGFHPMSLYAENPLLKYPRNLGCFCGSNVKFKSCCQSKQSRIVPAAWAAYLAGYMKEVNKRQAE